MPNHWLFDFYAGNSLGILALNAIYRASVLGAISSHFKQVLLQRKGGVQPHFYTCPFSKNPEAIGVNRVGPAM